MPIPASEMIKRFREGNLEYVRAGGSPSREKVVAADIANRTPVATVVACSDIHMMPEQVLGLEPGELYIVQTPGAGCNEGNVRDVGFYAPQTESPLVLVLGHFPCPLVEYSLKAGTRPLGEYSDEIESSSSLSRESSPPPAHSDICSAHASLTARTLSSALSDSNVRVEAAVLDEGTGEVRFLGLH